MGPLIDVSTISQEYKENINVTLKRHLILYLNSNSIRSNFDDLHTIVGGNIDVLCIADN